MWKPIASSVPGASHIKYGKLCQDYSNFCTVEDVIIGAVADGAGSAKYSQIGAELSV
ncbi:protein phosphatase 2C domain-containing protein, partial [Nostoc sp. NIES-2111]